MARSGSKYLRSLLNLHPDVEDFGEYFHNRKQFSDEQAHILERFASLSLSSSKYVGLQFRFPRHFKEYPEIVNLLSANKAKVKVIFLMRRNKLKGAISQQNAELLKRSTGKAHLFSGSSSIGKLNLEIDRAVKESLEREKNDAEYLNWAQKHFDTHVVYYEDLCEKPKNVANGILSFIGASEFKADFDLSSTLKKVTSDNLEEAIENYEELEREITKAGKQIWLDKPVEKKKLKSKVRNVFSTKISLNNERELVLNCDTFHVKTLTTFLEHFVDIDKDIHEVICAQGDLILISENKGAFWHVYQVEESFQKCFTLTNGNHLLQAKTGKTYTYSKNWKLLSCFDAGDFPWHGTWSIDQNRESGTTIWCEYPYASNQINVWRTEDFGLTWQKCFSISGHESNPKLGEIRHFHLVQKCSKYPKRWYLASGDTELQSKFWVSEDDGLNWSLVPISKIINKPNEVDSKLIGKFHRFTSIIQTEDFIFYPTDDTFNKVGARICVIDKSNLSEIKVLPGSCGSNEMRNFVQVNEQFAIGFSESKLDKSGVNVVVVDLIAQQIVGKDTLINEQTLKSNFMNSLSSKSAQDSVFYSYSDNCIFRPTPRVLKWEVELHHKNDN